MLLCANPRAQYLAHKAAIDAAVLGVLDAGVIRSKGRTASDSRRSSPLTSA